MQIRAELARVVVTVKASPQPSTKYGDTVCVAGVRVDGGRAEWVRLYPVPFRWLDGPQQFHKYDLIDVEVRRAAGDSRPESYRPDIETIAVAGHLEGWQRRHAILERLPVSSTCDLSSAAGEHHDAPSLGVVPVADVSGLEFTTHGEWSEAQQRRIAASVDVAPLSIFGTGNTPRPLKAPRFVVRYRYRCTAARCPGHVGQILDWELTALQNRQRVPDSELKRSISEKFLDQMFADGRATSFFMGNFEDARKRHSFSVLGVYYPPRAVASSVGLFDLDDGR